MTFRLWKRPHVKAGKTYETGFGAVEIEDVRVVPAALVSADDVRLAGLSDAASVWNLAGEHTGTAVGPETLLHRVQFRYLGKAAAEAEVKRPPSTAGLGERLDRMDRLSRRGRWTLATLRLIEAGEGVPARVLAPELGLETSDFKANVRKLKALGLTVSLEVGYELSDLGREYLAWIRKSEAV